MDMTHTLKPHQEQYLTGRLGTWTLQGTEILNSRGRKVGYINRNGNIELVKGAK